MKKAIIKRDKNYRFSISLAKGTRVLVFETANGLIAKTSATDVVSYPVNSKDFEYLKNYVITGDNNFWYSTTGEITKKELKEAIKEVKQGIKKGIYETGDCGDAAELHIFETGWSDTIVV